MHTSTHYLSRSDVENYERDGYILIKDVFSPIELEVMIRAIEDGASKQQTYTQTDAEGNRSRLAIWHTLGNDIWAAASTSPKLVNPARILLHQEVAFFHGKVMLKEAHTGGAWEWHQDYGYWYDQGFLYPHLLSAFISLDPATRDNGCLSVLKGSHKAGRVEHVKIGSQFGIDRDRIALMEPHFERIYCEMAPGSALFFDCNLIHASEANKSNQHRRAFITAYTALGNPQIKGQLCVNEICPVGASDAILKMASTELRRTSSVEVISSGDKDRIVNTAQPSR